MEIHSLRDLYDMEYTVQSIVAIKQFWNSKTPFSCMGAPKDHHLLLYLNNCEAVYTLKDGKKLTAAKGSIVYTPVGSEYAVRFYHGAGSEFHTVGIRFLLLDERGVPFVLSDTPLVIEADNANYRARFLEMEQYCAGGLRCIGKRKSILYDLLFKLSGFFRSDYTKRFTMIAKGIAYLEQDEEPTLSVKELAAMCNVSEVYFRRLFRLYAGMSPVQYRTELKIGRAKQLLEQDERSVSEIAEVLKFSDTSYFVKQFKRATGKTPHEYRKQVRNKLYF